jgi:hypothetical protein
MSMFGHTPPTWQEKVELAQKVDRLTRENEALRLRNDMLVAALRRALRRALPVLEALASLGFLDDAEFHALRDCREALK